MQMDIYRDIDIDREYNSVLFTIWSTHVHKYTHLYMCFMETLHRLKCFGLLS